MSVAADIRAERAIAKIADQSSAIDHAISRLALQIDAALDEVVPHFRFPRFTAERTRACNEAARKAICGIIREHAGEIPAEIEFLHLGCGEQK